MNKEKKGKNKSLFKFPQWINEDNLKNDSIISVISEEYIQMESEEAIGRRLSDVELNRFSLAWYDDEKVSWNRMVLVREAIEEIIKNPDEWIQVDKDYLDENGK